MSARKPDHGSPRAKTTASRSATSGRPLKDPVPDRACGTCLVAICCAGSPDRDAQLAAFDRDHPEPTHVRVRRLPEDRGDVSWGWTPGAQKRVSAAPAQRTPATGAAAVLGRSRRAAEQIASLQGDRGDQ